ncbi:hypothetical protein PHISCL_01922 [Aspergillus sclerotialis]|uniref:Uncharacterized protein n=1 Tax=Aspergillus sclerotialis TaxID=2070753 RepID=A0A3A3A221_9EURO|nr:hypothetical protein PHISCL_01922 [Aspergillus sclerotialis]
MFSTRGTDQIVTRIPQLETRFDFYRWFRALKNHVRADLWTYFDPDSDRVYEEPEPPNCSSVRKGAIGIGDFDTLELKLCLSFRPSMTGGWSGIRDTLKKERCSCGSYGNQFQDTVYQPRLRRNRTHPDEFCRSFKVL